MHVSFRLPKPCVLQCLRCCHAHAHVTFYGQTMVPGQFHGSPTARPRSFSTFRAVRLSDVCHGRETKSAEHKKKAQNTRSINPGSRAAMVLGRCARRRGQDAS